MNLFENFLLVDQFIQSFLHDWFRMLVVEISDNVIGAERTILGLEILVYRFRCHFSKTSNVLDLKEKVIEKIDGTLPTGGKVLPTVGK